MKNKLFSISIAAFALIAFTAGAFGQAVTFSKQVNIFPATNGTTLAWDTNGNVSIPNATTNNSGYINVTKSSGYSLTFRFTGMTTNAIDSLVFAAYRSQGDANGAATTNAIWVADTPRNVTIPFSGTSTVTYYTNFTGMQGGTGFIYYQIQAATTTASVANAASNNILTYAVKNGL